jgi:diguanylate cyclase (GGDEF)-like protein/PAS domain S-box-containing protein
MRTPRILVLENDPPKLSELLGCLASLAYEVASESAAHAALVTARVFQPDLALVDLALEGGEGASAADLIHEELGIPVVFVTPSSDEHVSEQVRSSSSYGYLPRPFTPREVGTIVELALNRHRMERVIVLSEARFRLLFDQNPAGVVVETADGRILECNAALARMLGYDDPHRLRDLPASALFHNPVEDLERRHRLASGEAIDNEETRLRHKSGRAVWAVDNAVLVPDPLTGRGQILRTLLDITERKLMEEGLERLAYRDALTGLANRRLLEVRAEQTLAEARRRGERAALVFMDLIGFKQVNDRVGHRAGDELLVQVARRLQSSLRRTDAAARFGGDEFMVLLSGVDDPPAAERAAERILKHLSAPFALTSGEMRLEARAGVAVYPDHARTFDRLVDLADRALMRAKAQSGSVVILPEPGPASSAQEPEPGPETRGAPSASEPPPEPPSKPPAPHPTRGPDRSQGTSATDAGAL